MVKFDFIFIVLVYRDYFDLNDLCLSLKEKVKGIYKVIVVDAFFDAATSNLVKETALNLGCDFVSIENKGYGYGNNRGIEYAKKHYEYQWMIICNPDTVLKSPISIELLSNYQGIIAPNIISQKGKHQNPYWAYKNDFSELLIYQGYKLGNKVLIRFGVGINKLLRDIFLVRNSYSKGRKNRVYAAHGSFLILNKKFIDKYSFDEKMFLFYEEACLAYQAYLLKIEIMYAKEIVVYHKEDGSMDLAKINEYPYLKDSYIHYFERCKNG